MKVFFRTFSVTALAFAVFGCSASVTTPVATITSGNSPDTSPPTTPGGVDKTVVVTPPAGLPDHLEVDAKFIAVPDVRYLQDDDGRMVATLGAEVNAGKFSVEIHDQLNLAKASSHSFITPALGDCELKDYNFAYIGMSDSIFQVGGKDKADSLGCQDFVVAIKIGGVKMKFTDVPPYNAGGATIKTVTVTIAVPTN